MPTGLPPTKINTGTDAPTVACQICRDDVAIADTVALRACGHRFCATCISQYLDIKIREGAIELACFHQDETATGDHTDSTCGKLLVDEDIQTLVTIETYTTLTRFRLIKSNTQARQCPFCDNVQIHGATAKSPACVCDCCGRGFCFTHGNAHSDKESCSQYERRQSRDNKRSVRVVYKISRPCPECARPIEKNGGCSHMTCRVCQAQFCWHCGMKWGFNRDNHDRPLHIESCDGLIETRLFPVESTPTPVRVTRKAVYYLTLVAVAYPLTLAFSWAWIPYTLWAEDRAVARRARVLARFITIEVSLAIMAIVVPVVSVVTNVSGWLFEMLLQGLRALRRLVCNCSCCCRGRNGVSEKPESGSDYNAYQDAAQVV